jgi:molybdate transport system substrate-binding protein
LPKDYVNVPLKTGDGEDIMPVNRVIAAAAAVAFALPLLAAHAKAAELKVLSTNAFKGALEELGPQFEKATENKVTLSFAPTTVIKTQIEQRAVFDVAVLTSAVTDGLAAAGKIVPDSRRIVARAGMGVAILNGAPKPDLSTVEAFKNALMNAKSIGFNGQGASRADFEALFKKLGIADALAPKIKLLQTGAPEGVVKGEVEIGLGPISEVIPTPGVQVAGPLPADIQTYLVLSAGISADSKAAAAAAAFINFLGGPSTVPVLKAKGMEPG